MAATESILQTLVSMHRKGHIPYPSQNSRFDVYRLKQSVRVRNCYVATESIAFTVDGVHFLAVGLALDEENTAFPRVTEYTKPSTGTSALRRCGETVSSTLTLTEKAKEVFREFGRYSRFRNNCQDFCNQYLRKIGINDHRFTDADIGLASGAGTVLGVIGAVVIGVLVTVLRR